VPYGYATEQHGSGVILESLVSSGEAPAQKVTVRNVSTERITGLQFVAALKQVGANRPVLWSITPNPAAVTGENTLNLQKLFYSRDLITRDASRSRLPFAACRDDHNASTSHGGIVPILNEPGHFMRCDNGRWIDAPLK